MNKQLTTKFKIKGLTPYVFLALFFVAQIGLINHQFSHKATDTQTTCLICIFTPNHIHENTLSLTIETTSEVFDYNKNIDDVFNAIPNIHYLGRAPPMC